MKLDSGGVFISTESLLNLSKDVAVLDQSSDTFYSNKKDADFVTINSLKTGTQLDVILAEEKHIDGVLKLCKACVQNMQKNKIDQWDDIYPNKEDFLRDIQSLSLYLIFSDFPEEIIGCIVLNEYQDPEYSDVQWKYEKEKVAVIHRLMIHPQYQGRGIAQSIVDYMEKLAKERSYGAIRLDTFDENINALNLYKKLGYEITGKVTFRKGEFTCFEKLL